MAKKKELELNDVLTKLSYIFPSDMYILDRKDVVEGKKSFERNDGHYTCSLSTEAVEVIKKYLPKKKYIYISDVKKAKKDLDEFLSTDIDDDTIMELEAERSRFLTKCEDIEIWNELNINEKIIDDIFIGKETTILIPEYNKLEIEVSKSLLPLITKKNINELRYSTRKVEGLPEVVVDVVFCMEQELFNFYMVYSYLVC